MTQSSTVALFQILHMHHTLGHSLVDSGCICSSVSFRGGVPWDSPPPKILRNFSIIYNTK